MAMTSTQRRIVDVVRSYVGCSLADKTEAQLAVEREKVVQLEEKVRKLEELVARSELLFDARMTMGEIVYPPRPRRFWCDQGFWGDYYGSGDM